MSILLIGFKNPLLDLVKNEIEKRNLDYVITDDEEKVFNIVKSNSDNSIVIADMSNISFDLISFLCKIRNEIGLTVNFIILLDDFNIKVIKNLVDLNSIGFIVKSNVTNELITKNLSGIISKARKEHNDKRKYIRIVPDENDDIGATIKVSNDETKHKSKILNLSFGGIAIKFDRKCCELSISDTVTLNLLIFEREVSTKAFVVFVKENVVGLKFIQADMKFQNIVSMYIFNKLSYHINGIIGKLLTQHETAI